MFFLLSKVLLFFIRPLNWIVLLTAYALWGKREKWKRRSLKATLVLLVFFTNKFLFNLAVRAWEAPPLPMDQIERPYDIGILLGGYSNPDIIPSGDRFNFSDRANRFINTLELYHKGKIRRLLLTGGTGDLLQVNPKEAAQMKPFLRTLGIPDTVLLIEDESRNTWENAVFTTRLIHEKFPGARCLLITSAWHMPRAQGCFARTGLEVTPFPVDYLSERHVFLPRTLLLPDSSVPADWDLLIKEWVGYVAYWVRGYIRS